MFGAQQQYLPYQNSNGQWGYMPTNNYSFDPMAYSIFGGMGQMANLGNSIGQQFWNVNQSNQMASLYNKMINANLMGQVAQSYYPAAAQVQVAPINAAAQVQSAYYPAAADVAIAPINAAAQVQSAYYPYAAQVQSQQLKNQGLSSLLGGLAGMWGGQPAGQSTTATAGGLPPGSSPAQPVNARQLTSGRGDSDLQQRPRGNYNGAFSSPARR